MTAPAHITARSAYNHSIRVVEVDENPALYAEAHIPGAIGFDWKKDLQDQVKRDFLGPAEFGELFGSRGISNDHTIVLYGDRNNWIVLAVLILLGWVAAKFIRRA